MGNEETMTEEKQTFEERRSAHLARQKEIAAELVKHKASSKEAVALRKTLESSLEETKRLRSKRVNDLLEEHFIGSSEKGMLHQVLQSAITEPKLAQLLDNVEKLRAQERWHSERITDLNLESQKIVRDLGEIDCDEAAANICQWFADMQATIRLLQQKYEPGMQYLDTLKLRSEELATKNWTQRLTDAGVEEWQLSLLDNVMGDHRTSDVIEWLHNVSRSSCNGKNPFYRGEVTTRKFAPQSVWRDVKQTFAVREQPTYTAGR
jgi:hypothetical protein